MNKQQLANKIWESANRMRSKIEANEYKDYILGFIFYKFLSDKEVAFLKKDGEIYDKETLYWAGYIYRYWSFYTGESSREIYKQAPAETMSRNWLIFHTLAPEVAIDDLKEIYRQRNSN